MSSAALGQYFRAFLVKLNMVESQLGQMYLGGQSTLCCSNRFSVIYSCGFSADDVSFAIVLELRDDQSPSVSHSEVSMAFGDLSVHR